MKIAYIMPYTYWGGGLQMNRLTLLQELVNYENLDITIIVLEYSGKTSLLFKEMGLKEICLNRKAKFIYPLTSYALYQALKEIEPDIIHTGNVDADIHGYIASRFLKYPKLIVEEIGSAQDRKPIMRKICGFVYQRADKVLCVSPDILEDMKMLQGLRRDDVSLTYNPVNLTHLQHTEKGVKDIRDKYSLSDDELIFGIVSRFELFKGHTYLFEAYEKFMQKHENSKLLVIGDGPLKEDLKDEVCRRGLSDHVIFTGMVGNVGDYLSLIDVFVHPSTKEPFGISIIEAMYMENAVISTNVGGPKNYIQNGQNGVLVEPRNSDELSIAMMALYGDSMKRKVLGAQAKKTVIDRFLPANYARKIYDIYQSVIDDGSLVD
ncbi:glycosyltransferase [Akkermansiaceae bacterium]|nr:glycosyltransferase [Akkermansiaceae bacterium]